MLLSLGPQEVWYFSFIVHAHLRKYLSYINIPALGLRRAGSKVVGLASTFVCDSGSFRRTIVNGDQSVMRLLSVRRKNRTARRRFRLLSE